MFRLRMNSRNLATVNEVNRFFLDSYYAVNSTIRGYIISNKLLIKLNYETILLVDGFDR